jgi:hypothetical protein
MNNISRVMIKLALPCTVICIMSLICSPSLIGTSSPFVVAPPLSSIVLAQFLPPVPIPKLKLDGFLHFPILLKIDLILSWLLNLRHILLVTFPFVSFGPLLSS